MILAIVVVIAATAGLVALICVKGAAKADARAQRLARAARQEQQLQPEDPRWWSA